jgi:hypothetical protein
MKALFIKYRRTLLFTLIGATIGFAYWRIIGCTSGTCPLTANWHTSTLFGGLIGMLAFSSRAKSDHVSETEQVAEAGEDNGSGQVNDNAVSPQLPGNQKL